MKKNSTRRTLLISLSPWLVIAGVLVLLPIAAFIAFTSYHRDRENTIRLMTEKGEALIRSFEAGTRAGMIHMGWGGSQVQRLLEETARQKGIAYLVVTDEDGRILVDSDSARIGESYDMAPLPSLAGETDDRAVHWRMARMEGDGEVFEVYRRYVPMRRGRSFQGGMHGRGHMMMWGPPGSRPGPESPGPPLEGPEEQTSEEPVLYIFVGLDLSPLNAATREAVRHAVILAAVMVVGGFAGLVTLLLAQGYRLARRSLERVQAFSDQVVDKMPMGLVATDEQGDVAVFNSSAAAIIQCDASEMIGRPIRGVLPGDFRSLVSRLDIEEGLLEQDAEWRLASGESVPLSVSGALLRDDGGNFLGYVFIFRDLREVRRLQREVERSRRLASVGSLAAGVAHEIRNPLSSIKGFATYFKERYGENAQDRETANVMIEEVERLDRVIRELLEFARPTALNLRVGSLDELIRRSLRLVEGDAKKKRVEICTEIQPDLPPMSMDWDRLSQVFLNLYLNSLQAMPEGGVLTVRVNSRPSQSSIFVDVSDTGQGIAQGEREQIFDPYFTTKSDGTGLGLAIVHRIVDAHGGSIRVESAPGTGTTITIVLPMSHRRPAEFGGSGETREDADQGSTSGLEPARGEDSTGLQPGESEGHEGGRRQHSS